ncbi:hypothetical protein PMAYCL1PPCAC_24095 [Pristionchus mayeri]|uniref:Protein-tyrosine-phosphatase n=1 Tax=Pristionchus mayeri TaxID=1317129 RepID=A0AAN5D0N6_9BILA|nr:hypothetical protein PMAYCL1PPCAC_24095 [Pristionchus mayeri]
MRGRESVEIEERLRKEEELLMQLNHLIIPPQTSSTFFVSFSYEILSTTRIALPDHINSPVSTLVEVLFDIDFPFIPFSLIILFEMSNSHYRISPLHQITEIKTHLFLSGIAVIKPDPVGKLGITTIVNATTEENTPPVRGVDVVRIRVDDHPSANLGIHFHVIADKIKSVKDGGGKVLVHCMAGVSRSASLVLAYLVKYERMTLKQAYYYVKSVRPIIHPNLGFWKQLVDFERRLRGTPTVALVPTRLSPYPVPDVYAEELREAERKDERDKERAAATAASIARTPPPFSSLSLTRPSPSVRPSYSPLSTTSYRSSALSPTRTRIIPISRSTPSSLSRSIISPSSPTVRFAPSTRLTTTLH